MEIAIGLIAETFGEEPINLTRLTLICYRFEMYSGLKGDVNILDKLVGIYE